MSTVNGIQLFVGQTRTVDAKLTLGAVTAHIDVQATAEALEKSDAQIGAVIETRQCAISRLTAEIGRP